MRVRWHLGLTLMLVAGCTPGPSRTAPRPVLTGGSELVAAFDDAALQLDVPAEILAALAVVETGLRPPPEVHHPHASPAAVGIMGLPEQGAVRSVGHAAEALGVSPQQVRVDRVTNIRAAAALLRSLAPADLRASGDRDRWLEVVAAYFDAGAAGEGLARSVRRAIARGVETTDAQGRSFVIRSYAELYGHGRAAPVGKIRLGLHAEYAGATWVAAHSSNYTSATRGNADIDVVVLHTTQGSYAGAISWFRNSTSNVSAHYVIRKSDGAITQMLHHEDIGWHAGNSSYNRRSIGIEHEGYVADPATWTPAMLASSAQLTRWLCDTLGIPKDRNHIVGHNEVPGATHTDPGPHFPWNSYMSMVRSGGGSTPPPPPPPGGATGTLQGVVYIGSDTGNRVPGATVTVMPGGQSITARSTDGFWSFELSPGTYTVVASATGYRDGTSTRSVTDGAVVWGSIRVEPASAGDTGKIMGVVYDATKGDLETRIEGATVELSNGDTVVVDATGSFDFDVPPGDYRITASKTGWQTASVQRTVTAGQQEWGSVGLVPEMMMPTNRAPQVPTLIAPVAGATSRSTRPLFRVGGLSDPEGDAITLEVEILSGPMGEVVSTGKVITEAGDPIASWNHPQDDLPRSASLYWRARAQDGSAASPWTAAEPFRTPRSMDPATPSQGAFQTQVTPGVGDNGAPGAPTIVEPADASVSMTARPQVVVGRAQDPEGDALVYEVEIAADDVFESILVVSDLLDDTSAQGPTWQLIADLAPGSRYYVRARAADDRVFGPWGPSAAFSVSADAATSPDERPGISPDMGGAPMLEATVDADPSSCASVGGQGSPWFGLMVLLAVARRDRRRRRAR